VEDGVEDYGVPPLVLQNELTELLFGEVGDGVMVSLQNLEFPVWLLDKSNQTGEPIGRKIYSRGHPSLITLSGLTLLATITWLSMTMAWWYSNSTRAQSMLMCMVALGYLVEIHPCTPTGYGVPFAAIARALDRTR